MNGVGLQRPPDPCPPRRTRARTTERLPARETNKGNSGPEFAAPRSQDSVTGGPGGPAVSQACFAADYRLNAALSGITLRFLGGTSGREPGLIPIDGSRRRRQP